MHVPFPLKKINFKEATKSVMHSIQREKDGTDYEWYVFVISSVIKSTCRQILCQGDPNKLIFTISPDAIKEHILLKSYYIRSGPRVVSQRKTKGSKRFFKTLYFEE